MTKERVPLKVKWGKESFNVEIVVSHGVLGMKSQLESMTSVPRDRMKLMAKSKGTRIVVQIF